MSISTVLLDCPRALKGNITKLNTTSTLDSSFSTRRSLCLAATQVSGSYNSYIHCILSSPSESFEFNYSILDLLRQVYTKIEIAEAILKLKLAQILMCAIHWRSATGGCRRLIGCRFLQGVVYRKERKAISPLYPPYCIVSLGPIRGPNSYMRITCIVTLHPCPLISSLLSDESPWHWTI